MALTFCSAVAGLLAPLHPASNRLRVTLHRTVKIADEIFLQQACDYVGLALKGDENTAARTFPAKNATMGLALQQQRIVRSVKNVEASVLQETMKNLSLNVASRSMMLTVKFVLAIPLQISSDKGLFTCGVIYIDSEAQGFHLNNSQVIYVAEMARCFLQNMVDLSRKPLDRIASFGGHAPNVEISSPTLKKKVAPKYAGLEYVGVPTPKVVLPSGSSFALNFEHVDFLKVIS